MTQLYGIFTGNKQTDSWLMETNKRRAIKIAKQLHAIGYSNVQIKVKGDCPDISSYDRTTFATCSELIADFS